MVRTWSGEGARCSARPALGGDRMGCCRSRCSAGNVVVRISRDALGVARERLRRAVAEARGAVMRGGSSGVGRRELPAGRCGFSPGCRRSGSCASGSHGSNDVALVLGNVAEHIPDAFIDRQDVAGGLCDDGLRQIVYFRFSFPVRDRGGIVDTAPRPSTDRVETHESVHVDFQVPVLVP